MVKKVKVEMPQELYTDLLHDERVGFYPSLKYMRRAHLCEKAVNEIINKEVTVVSPKDYLLWVKKHKAFYHSRQYPIRSCRRFMNFNTMYDIFRDASNFYKNNVRSEKAISEYNLLEIEKEELLLKWLVKYERLYDKMTFSHLYNFPYKEELKTGFIRVLEKYDVKIAVSDFTHSIVFMDLFDEKQYTMLEKYKTYTPEEELEFDSHSEDGMQRSSLKYQLKKRGMI
jgi:hypothetical protein